MNLKKLIFTNNACYKAGRTIAVKGIMVHSTGANNPNLCRYVGPDDGLLGKNAYNNHWNQDLPDGRQVCVHGFIGKLKDGSVATYQTLPWNHRGWHGGSGSKGSVNDTHIGFECCEDGLTDRAYFEAVYKEATELCAYLCREFNLDPMKDGVIIGHYEGYQRGIASNHGDPANWFPRFGKTMDDFRKEVKRLLDAGGSAPVTPATPTSNDEVIWNFLMGKGLNAYAAAGIMGNLYAESGLKPTNLQNSYEKSLGFTDESYTAAVDSGSYTNFVRDSAGYGLAQWTYYTRKQALLDFAKSAGASIGDLKMQLDFLWKELQGYIALMNILKTATSVKQASDAVLTDFERPADQSDTAKTKRAGYGQGYYDKFAKVSAPPTMPTAVKKGDTVKLADNATYYDGKAIPAWVKADKWIVSSVSGDRAVIDKNLSGTNSINSPVNVKFLSVVGASAPAPITPAFTAYTVKVTADVLNIRKGPGTNYAVVGTIKDKGVYTIVEETVGTGAVKWGKLKSGAGWVSLDFCRKA
ncbi:MAG: phage tail tip lysozyme [Firmicutes bacterium]|nr:phage tail tip lysozyme [Bacillota bacterium]